MTHKQSNIFLYGAVIAIILFLSYLVTPKLRAAVSNFTPTTCYTAAATSTLKYMTPGTATTTVQCAYGADGAKNAVLAIEVNASSTSSVFTVGAEQSMDGVDWYPLPVSQMASTTNPFTLTSRQTAQFAFASSTVGGEAVSSAGIGVNGTQNRNHYTFTVPTQMRLVRAFISVQGTNAGVWMQIYPRENIN